MPIYIHQLKDWPNFVWDQEKIAPILIELRHLQGRLLGKMERLGFNLQAEANLHTLTLDILKSSEIEGEILNPDQVQSSIARRLGMDIGGLIPADLNVEGMVEMLLDATQKYKERLSQDRLFDWHAAMFPTGRSGMQKIQVANYRDNPRSDPMRVLSGPIGKEKVHFEAPDSALLPLEMGQFINWFNEENNLDPMLKSAIAHLWFVTIHPFDDGNGRMARAITDMQLCRADLSSQRFYSMSAQIRKEKNFYYEYLEKTQKGSLEITVWLEWFIGCLDRALVNTQEELDLILKKARFWENRISTNLNDRQRIMLNKLMDGFEGKLTSSKWAKITKTSQDSAVRDINDLVNKNIFIQGPAGGRSTSYLLKED
jgi:Fic family protein